jgi:hypothetical protein
MITVPGLDVPRHWSTVQDRLLDDFPQVTDVLATTIAATLLIVYEGHADTDGWLAGIDEGILGHQVRSGGHRNLARPHASRSSGAPSLRLGTKG